jgi:hypothetical protein
MSMGLVSMILELRENGGLNADDPASAMGDVPAGNIKTRPLSEEDNLAHEAISLRTFALRLDTAKRRAHKLHR